MSLARTLCAATVALLGSGPAVGQAVTPADSELARIRTDFEYGKYAEVLERAAARIVRGKLSESEAIELHKYAGLSAFYLRKQPQAESHLWALLQLDPDYALDPFVVPPPAIAYLESLRKQRSQQLDAIREQRRMGAERLSAESQERARSRAEAELQRRRIEELSQRLNEAPIPARSMALNFVPFGIGQFQQKRTRAGVLFAVTEGVLAATSIAAYLFYDALIQNMPVTVDDRLTPDGTFTFYVRGIPSDRHQRASVLRTIKYGSAAAFFVVYGIGVGDAIIHHRDPVAPAAAPPSAEAVSSNPGDSQLGVVSRSLPDEREPPRVFVAPIAGGLSAGITLRF